MAAPAYAAIVPVTLVATKGEQAPGTPPGTTFQSFASAEINSAGEVLVRAGLTGPGITSANDNGVWSGPVGALQLHAREGDQAPGMAPGVVFTTLFIGPFNDQGAMYFYADVAGPGVTTANNRGLWYGTPGTLQLIVREGDPAPGLTNGETVLQILGGNLNENGQITLILQLDGPTVTSANQWGFWAGAPNALMLVAREGDPAAGVPGAFYDFNLATQNITLNASGDVVFNARLTGAASGWGVWSGAPGSVTPVIRAGDPAPGTAPGVVMDFIRSVRINDAGEIAFGGFVTGPGISSANNAGVWSGPPGSLQLVARNGDPVPGGAAGEVFALGSFPAAVSLNGNGLVALAPGARIAGPGVTTANDQGVFFGAPGSLQLIAREGDQAPGAPAGAVLVSPRRTATNTADEILWDASIDGGGVPNGSTGVWLTSQGATQLLLRRGDQIEYAPGLTQSVNTIGLFSGGGTQSGFLPSLNDQGHAVLQAGDNSAGGRLFVIPPLPTGPVADAGPDQTEDEGLMVPLDGSASTGAVNYAWSQLAGPAVALSDPTVVSPTFYAPFVPANTTLTFQLIVDDGAGNFSDPDTVDVTVVDVNSPPVADAGNDATVKEGAVATLDGSLSFDPEGDTPLGYTWTQTAGPLVSLQPGNTVVSPTFIAPLGVGNMLTFELVVDDGRESSAPDSVTIMIVENTAPVADAGPDQTVDEGTNVNLDGTASSDADGGDTLSFDWSEPVPLDDDTSPTPSFAAPFVSPGGQDLDFDLVVTDDDPVNPRSSAPDRVTISVRNVNDPPSCDLARATCPDSKIRNNDGCTLWPPNHRLIDVSIEGVMDTDATYNDVTLTITGVTQDEPVNGAGDGDSSPDAVVQSGGQVDSVLIRAERQGGGNGRVYTVNFTADDGFESCQGAVTVGVPHSRRDDPVDNGQVYNSMVP